jgi:hypothetical protein
MLKAPSIWSRVESVFVQHQWTGEGNHGNHYD